jgi:hypothetical protein
MIRYALRCASDHTFEAWFRSSVAFDEQSSSGKLTCPTCGSRKIDKALMAPVISKSAQSANAEPVAAPHALTSDPRAKALAEAIKRLRRHVVETSDYVGERFPEEARRIHYQEAEHRGIYGEASAEDARELMEEGIDVLPLPHVPDEHN